MGRRSSSATASTHDGRPVASIDPLGNRTTSVWPATSRLSRETPLVASINPLGRRSTTVYDAGGRRIGSVDPLGNRSTFLYNAAGDSIASINPLGNRWTTVYDSAGRSVATVNPLGKRNTVAVKGHPTLGGKLRRMRCVSEADSFHLWVAPFSPSGSPPSRGADRRAPRATHRARPYFPAKQRGPAPE